MHCVARYASFHDARWAAEQCVGSAACLARPGNKAGLCIFTTALAASRTAALPQGTEDVQTSVSVAAVDHCRCVDIVDMLQAHHILGHFKRLFAQQELVSLAPCVVR